MSRSKVSRQLLSAARSASDTLSDDPKPPLGLRWRSNTFFILATVGVGMFTDLFLYGLIVPILPFMLHERIDLPSDQIQSHVDGLLAAYAGASMLFSPVAGWIADKTSSRQLPFLGGLFALLISTILLSVGASLPVLVIARILQGTSAAVVWTVGLALCMDTVGPENLGKAIGSIFSFISVGSLAAPVVGGALYSKTGYLGIFGCAGALLCIDFIMRLTVLEKHTAARFLEAKPNATSPSREDQSTRQDNEDSDGNLDEESPLLAKAIHMGLYDIPPNQPKLVQKVPLLYCFRDPSLVTALLIGFIQALVIGTFDATVPTYAEELFEFDSLKAGLLFIPLGVSDLLLGPIAGWAVDKYGSRPIGILSYGWLVPVLVAMRAVHYNSQEQLIIYCVLLALSGVGVAATGASPLVEAGAVIQRYHKANPDFFGDNGPYAQLYGINNMFWCSGLTLGPLIFGALKDSIGYGNMNAVLAGICAVASLACWCFLGRIRKASSRDAREEIVE